MNNQFCGGLLGGEYYVNSVNGVVDENTFSNLELDKLAQHVSSHAITNTGKAQTASRIFNPSTSAEEICKKQDALRELCSKDKLKRGIEDVLSQVYDLEDEAGKFLSGNPLLDKESMPYNWLKSTRNLLHSVPKWANEIQVPESEYLKNLREDLIKFQEEEDHKLTNGLLVRQLGKIMPAEGADPLLYPITNPFHWAKHIPIGIGVGTVTLGFGLMGLPNIIKEIDVHQFINPLQNIFRENEQVGKLLRAIGSLDELIAHDSFRKDFADSILPRILERERHEFHARGLVNPLQYLNKSRGYVPNDLDLEGLVFVTGANSGGKTSIATAAQHAQILFQAGCYVPSREAAMTVTNKIYNQTVDRNGILDEWGGLGSKLKRTREIFYGSSSRSFAVIDDSNDATTYNEQMEISRKVLSGFHHKGPTTVFITHLPELAQEFQGKGVGRYYQVEFNGERPTHRIVSGISSISYANLVAEKMGLDEKSIIKHLQEKGYLPSSGKLEVERRCE